MLYKIIKRHYTFKVDDTPFNIDITVENGLYESWLHYEGYGFKLFMFGIKNTNIEDFKRLVYADVWAYMQEYIDIKNRMEEESIYA